MAEFDGAWKLPLTPTPGYVAALAAQDQVTIRIAPPRLVYWQGVSPEN